MIENEALREAFTGLTTPLLADACLKRGLSLRTAPSGARSVVAGARLAGRVLPCRHYGSVDVFLEAIGSASPGDVLVIDNLGRRDEACVGDLTALEARAAGLAGMIVWGLHRDTRDLEAIGFPLFSYGAFPAGPRRLEPREPEALVSARFGGLTVGRDDVVFADEDGIVFLGRGEAGDVIRAAAGIGSTERAQAARVAEGRSLRDQLSFSDFLREREKDPSYSFRRHLRRLGGAIEE